MDRAAFTAKRRQGVHEREGTLLRDVFHIGMVAAEQAPHHAQNVGARRDEERAHRLRVARTGGARQRAPVVMKALTSGPFVLSTEHDAKFSLQGRSGWHFRPLSPVPIWSKTGHSTRHTAPLLA